MRKSIEPVVPQHHQLGVPQWAQQPVQPWVRLKVQQLARLRILQSARYFVQILGKMSILFSLIVNGTFEYIRTREIQALRIPWNDFFIAGNDMSGINVKIEPWEKLLYITAYTTLILRGREVLMVSVSVFVHLYVYFVRTWEQQFLIIWDVKSNDFIYEPM